MLFDQCEKISNILSVLLQRGVDNEFQ